VKLCGVTRPADVQRVAAAGADAVGVVVDVAVDTPREVSRERAADLFDAAPPFLTTVAVSMPGSVDAAVAIVDATGADALQVHGGFDADAFAAIRARTGRPVVAALDNAAADRAHALADAGAVDAVLVDSADADGGGGTGETHDWTATRDLARDLDDRGTPAILAGGLTPDNVAEAVRTVRPHGVDVASGIEATPGRKDPTAVEAFVRAAGRAPTASADPSDGEAADDPRTATPGRRVGGDER
jgi:phosphoribosylanthranilate isomerase